MSGSAENTLRDVLIPRNEIVHPRDKPAGEAVFVGLEHIEPVTGRRVGSLSIRLEELTGRKARFHTGDIVYGYLRPYLNKVWVADFDGYCSVDQYVFEVTRKAAPEYVAAFMRSPTFLKRAPISESPGQLPRIRLDEILGVPMAVPPLEQQHRIAAHVADQVGATEKIRARAETMRIEALHLAGVLRASLFAGLTAPHGRIGHLIAEPGAIIDGPFGSNLKGDHYQAEGVRVIRLGNVGIGEFIDVDRAYVTEDHFASLSRHAATAGDIVVAALGDGARPAGRACMVPDELTRSLVKADCFRIRPNSRLLGPYLMQYLNSPLVLDTVAASSRGATRPRMTLGILKSIEVPAPTPSEQREVAAHLDEELAVVTAMTTALDAELEAIRRLPSALLHRTFEVQRPH